MAGDRQNVPVGADVWAAFEFCSGTVELMNRACEAAEGAFWSYGYSRRPERAVFLEAVAEEIKASPKAIMSIALQETGLPDARLSGECTCTGQLDLFATHIRQGHYLDRRHDPALPQRQPQPRPELRLIQRPVGPVAWLEPRTFRWPSSPPATTPPRRWQRAARWW